MAGRRRPEGTCHICGVDGPLSFEHVPPRAAFNNKRVIEVTFEDSIRLGPTEEPKGRIQQRGAGGYTLCERCNNMTGRWYGKHFVDWCYQAMDIMIRADGNPTLFYLNYLFPLAILKEIVAMFLSVNGVGFSEVNAALVRFVLDREKKYLPPKYRFFAYYNKTGRLRHIGLSSMGNLTNGSIVALSEITYPPLGYVMTIDSPPPDERLFEITHFARYGYKEFEVMELRMPALPVVMSYYAGDYRTLEEVEEQARQSRASMLDRRRPL